MLADGAGFRLFIIVGDGIHPDLQAMAAHLNAGAHGPLHLSRVEFQFWRDADGRMTVIISIALRTEVIGQRIIIGANGATLRLAPVGQAEVVQQALEERIDLARNSLAAGRRIWARLGMAPSIPKTNPIGRSLRERRSTSST